MGKLAMLAGLIMVRLPEAVLNLLYGQRETYRGQVIDAKAMALGRLANTVRIPGCLPTVDESREQSRQTAKMFDADCVYIRPNTDVAFMLGMMNYLYTSKKYLLNAKADTQR